VERRARAMAAELLDAADAEAAQSVAEATRLVATATVSGRFHLGSGPFWLRFTYVASVLVKKY
jgi:hypothetical protein